MSLTEDDKQWFASQLSNFHAAIDSKLDALRTSLTQEFDTKLERVETKLLTEFHKWASPMDARIRTHSAALRALDLEMEAISDRVSGLEPPH